MRKNYPALSRPNRMHHLDPIRVGGSYIRDFFQSINSWFCFFELNLLRFCVKYNNDIRVDMIRKQVDNRIKH